MLYRIPSSISRRIYTLLYIALCFIWPLCFYSHINESYVWSILTANAIASIFVFIYTSSRELFYYQGLDCICGSLESGCINISILYIPIVLIALYPIFLYITLFGLFKGRKYTQYRFIRIVLFFNKKKEFYKEKHDEEEYESQNNPSVGTLPDWIGDKHKQ